MLSERAEKRTGRAHFRGAKKRRTYFRVRTLYRYIREKGRRYRRPNPDPYVENERIPRNISDLFYLVETHLCPLLNQILEISLDTQKSVNVFNNLIDKKNGG